MVDTNPLSPTQRRQDFEERHRSAHTPDIGALVTINIPDEVVRATVERVISDNRIIGKIVNFTTASKSHNYKKDSFVAAEFRKGPIGVKGWYEISQDQLDAASEPEYEEPAAPPREMVEGDFALPRTRKAK